MKRSERPGKIDDAELFRYAVQMLPDIVYQLDPDGRFIYLNDAVRQIGYEPRELIGTLFTKIVHPDDRDRVSRDIVLPRYRGRRTGDAHAPKLFDERRTGSRGTKYLDVRLRRARTRREGEPYCCVELHSYGKWDRGVKKAGKKLLGSVGIMRDVTGRMRMQEVLRRQKEFAENLIETAPLIILVLDPAGKIVRFNSCMEALSGYRLEEVRGKNWFDTFLAVRDRSRIRGLFKRAMGDVGVYGNVNPILTRSGAVREIEWYSARLTDADKRTVGVLCVGKDITEWRKAECALRESEERFRAIFDKVKDGILVETPQGRILDANTAACAMLGYTRQELLGMTVKDLLPEDVAATLSPVIRASSVREGKYIEAMNRRKDGSWVPVEVSNTLMDIGGEKRVIAILRDITERKRVEEQLLHAQKMEAIGMLTGGIAHDFNNILAGLMGYASLMRMNAGESGTLKDDLESMERLMERGAGLTGKLLAFSRRGGYRPRPVAANKVIRDVLDMLRRTAGKNIDMVAVLSPDAPSVMMDEGELHQVIMNLCLNACEAMAEGGTITLRTGEAVFGEEEIRAFPRCREGRYLSAVISDTGAGIDDKTLERIFEPFFTTKDSKGGTGLGLAVVKSIIEKEGGSVGVSSAPGKGSSFSIYLPACEAKAVPAPAAPADDLRGDETIMVVDDERDFREGAARWLRGMGYQVIEASSGEEAVRALAAGEVRIDLVILDMVMKGMGGARVFKLARERAPRLPIIICTGCLPDRRSLTVYQKKADDFLRKPFAFAELGIRVRNVLDRRS